MPINVTWDNEEHTVIRWDFDGLWDWEGVWVATRQAIAMRESTDHGKPVSVILNMENAAPLKSNAIWETRTALMMKPENRDLVVVVGRSAYIQAVVEIFRRMYVGMADSFIGVETLNEARRLIRIRQTGNS